MTIARAQMNRQLYQMGGPIQEAESFYTNNLDMDPQEARSVLSNALSSYSQSMQPQSMMQMASNGGRIGYQMGGGIESMPMNFGQPLQVPPMGNPSFSPMQSMPSSPMLNYGQTPLTMNRGGIARLGYQMGGEAMMQPQMGGEMNMPQMNEQQALETIIQLLIEQGVDPETALKLAAQILQIFAQGGEPAVEAFANQLEQQEQAEAMAQGGIAGYSQRQGYFLGGIGKAIGSVFKGIGKAIKSVAKSPIGRIALTIGANMLLPGAGSAFAAAFQSAAINMGLQVVGGGKFNPLEALTAGIGGYANAGGFGDLNNIFGRAPVDPNIASGSTNITTNGINASTANAYNASGIGNTTVPYSGLESDISSMIRPTGLEGQVGTGYAAPKSNLPFQLQGAGDGSVIDANAITSDYSYPGTLDKLKTSASNFGSNMLNKAQTGIQNLYKDPIGTVSDLASSAYKTVKDNAIPLVTGAVLGKYAFGSDQGKDESDEDFAKRQQEEVNPLITYYGRNLQIKNPYFYQKFGATDPFAPIATAAQGGIMGYRKGGSMVPPARQIEGGVIELDARKSGGYIPYGKKERHDDVPAMLAKDEFVFTSKAVKAAGGGDAKRGAARMYAIMKQLEGARA